MKTFIKKTRQMLIIAMAGILTLSACSGENTEETEKVGEESTEINERYIPDPEKYEGEESGMVTGEIQEDMMGPTEAEMIDPYVDPYIYENTESYKHLEENDFVPVAQMPLSTFAADVDTASYANIRRFLNQGQMPDPDAVRIEEMLNYFSYDYPEPRGDEPFSVSMEIGPSPWNEDSQLLSIGLQAEDPAQNNRPNSNLVFLIDVSGSMEGADRLDLVKRAYLGLLDQLQPGDKISIVTYASQEAVLIEGADLDDKAEIMTAIENLDAGGSTYGSAGIIAAYEVAEENFIEGGNNRIILATDGDLNVGLTSEEDLVDLITEEKEKGVFLSVLAFGYGNYQDDRLEAIANNGNGHLSYIDTIAEARKVLSEELGSTLYTVAKDVKLQVDFNPAYVDSYRLIGYENRVMDAEDFRDDSKDGGEIGSGHSVTALYEIVPAGSGSKDVYSNYQDLNEKVEGEENGEILTLNIRYKEPDEDTSEELNYPLAIDSLEDPSDNHRLAVAIGGFGMLLKNSDYKGDLDYEMILDLLAGVETDDPYIIELIDLVEQAKLLDGIVY